MADEDFVGAAETRRLQSQERLKAEHWARLNDLGAYNLVKVIEPARAPQDGKVSGYFTVLTALSGLTPEQMRDMLGLRVSDLANGADIYKLREVPGVNDFEVRGYTTLVDGLRLAPGLREDSAGYRGGWGALQYTLNVRVPAVFYAHVAPGEPFVIPVHPKYLQGSGASR